MKTIRNTIYKSIKHTIAIVILLIIGLSINATNIEVSGTITTNTTWSGVDTVKVIGNITVNDAVTLTIDPGIIVEFQGHYYITIHGTLLAVGTASDIITFTVADTTGAYNYSHTGWNGLVFWNIDNANDTSKVIHSKLEYGKATSNGGNSADRGGAVCIAESHKILFDHCEFQHNYSSGFGGAIFIWSNSNADFSDCNIHHNYSVYDGGGIYSWESHNLYNSIVSNNTSEEEGGGIYLLEGTFDYRNNLISDNVSSSSGGGIFFDNPYNSTFINLTISNNHAYSGGGIAIENRNPGLRNCIIYGNTVSHSYSQIYYYLFQSTADYHYCDIQDYNGSGVGGGGNSNFSNCIDVDPDFINSGDNSYSLSATSQCINTGDPSTTTAEAGVYDLADNSRIYDGFVDRIDIGAYEYQGDPKPAIVSVWPFDDSKILNTTPTLEIEFSLEVTAQSAYITIYNDDNSVFEQIAANNTSLVTVDSVNVSINPTQDFAYNNNYYIQIDSLAFSNVNGQKFSGIYDQTSWNFSVKDIDGYYGTALDFDGTDDFVETSLNNLSGSEITIEYWFKGSSTQSAVRQQNSDYIVSGWNDLHILSNDGGTSNGIAIGAGAEDGNWHHIAMTWKQNTADGFVSYLDGQLIASRNSNNTPLPEIDGNVFFGSERGAHEFMDGRLDEIRIWNVVRTETEIRENMHHPISSTEAGIVSYFQFNEGQGTITYDLISSYIGTLHNMTANDWVNSTIPFGGGAVNSQFVSATGNIDFTNTGLSADFTAKTGTDTIVVTRIDTVPNITPATVDTVYDAQYWVINDFGNGTFTANLSFTIAEDLTPDDQSNPSNVRLYGRASNSHSDWTLITPANAVDAASNTATFNDVSSFGQFMLGRHEGTTPFLMTHLSPENEGSMYYTHNLEITFNEVATDVSGKSLWLYKSNGTLVEEFTLPSSQITGSGTDKITINPTNHLILDEQYYVLIDSGAFQDPFAKDFAGISDPADWSFRVLIHGHIISNTIWQDTIIATGNVYVDDGVTLTVAPGTRVEFHQYSKLDIKGTLLAVGTDTDPIIFTRMANNNRWNAIVFHNTPSSNDSSKIVHCILEHAEGNFNPYTGGPVYVDGVDKIKISNCVFRYSEGMGSALDCYNCEFTVSNNIFHNNYADAGGAISCGNNANITLINNVICNNQADNNGGAMYIELSQPVLLNNTICNNFVYNEDYETVGGGLYLSSAAITVRNNIIYGNTADSLLNQIYLEYIGGDPDFYYCDIEGGKDAFGGYGAGENYNGTYENNIDEVPQFTETGNHPYQIEITSPCHNTGDPATTTADVGSFDAAGNYRIQNERVDIGAYESYKTTDNFPGNALSFDGIDNYVNFGNDQTLDIANDITVQLWVKPDSVDNNCYVLKKGEIKLLHWDVSYESMSGKGFQLNLPGPNTGWWEFQYDMDYGKWYHVVWTFSNTGELKAYINGELSRQGNFPGNIQTNTDDLLLASIDGSQRYKGLVDEIRIWNTVLTAEEIRENMHRALTDYENNPLSYWQLNDGSGSTAVDISGESPGTLVNMNNDNWVNSSIAFGSGESNTQIVNATGNVIFTNTDIEMDFTAKTATDTIVIVRIDTIPNVNPEAVTAFDSQYWVINKFGNGTLTSNITFSLNENLSPLDESYPERIKLYKRSSTSDSAWTFYANASQVDAANNSATFNGISDFSQFIICRKATTDTVPGNALEFDGTDDYVFGTGIDTTLTAITIEAWVYHNSLPGTIQRYITVEPEVAVIRHDGYNGYHELHFYIKQSSGLLYGLSVDSIETINEWMHVTGTYDGTIIKLYLNGELIKSASLPQGGLSSPNGDFEFSSSDETMDGKMDEVRIWNYARSEQEIRENMYRTSTGFESELINYWQLNSSSGTTAIDIISGAEGTFHHMDDTDWVTSTVPTGIGNSNSQIVSNAATYYFDGTGLKMSSVNISNPASITVTRINLNPNINPIGNYTTFDSQYWTIVNYNTDSLTTNLSFEVSEDITVLDEIYPASIKLFSRYSNSDSSWILIDSAYSVNAAENKATFNSINHFSQFLIARGEITEISPGNCLNFDGANDYVSIPADTSLDNNEFAVEFWVSMDNPSEWTGIIDKGRHTLSDWYFVTGNPGQEEGTIFGIGHGSSPVVEIHFSWNDNHWHHVAGTYDGTTMKLYVDGILKSSRTVAMVSSDNGIHVGDRLEGGWLFSGKLDEVRIWDVAISEAQIRENMHKPLIGTENNLVSYWTFNESSGSIAHDLSSSNNGTLHHMTDNSWNSSTAPIPYFTVNNGDWESFGNWAEGQNIPTRSWARLRISHNISLNSNKEVIQLTIKPTGILTISSGFTLEVLE